MEQEQKIPSRETAIKRAIERMEWEGAPLVVKNSSFPERNGRIRPTTEEMAVTGPKLGQSK